MFGLLLAAWVINRLNTVKADPTHAEAPPAGESRTQGLPDSATTLTEADAKVLAEVEKLGNRKADWQGSILVLVISVAAFFGLGLLQNPLLDIAVIVGVLLLHELGHYVGMRLFGFKDVRMFFIPFFGAAVSGVNRGVPSYKRALVTLLGPVPGLVLAVALGLASMFFPVAILWHIAVLFFVINAFNLLPFLPLDGGRLIHEVLLQRNRHVEAAFRVLSGGALAAYGYYATAWVLAGLGVLVILSASLSFRLAGVAAKVRRALAVEPAGPVTGLAPEQAACVVTAVRRAFPTLHKPGDLAVQVEAVWDRLTNRPPGWLATLGFLALYGMCFLMCAVMFAGTIYAARKAPAIQAPEDVKAGHQTAPGDRPRE
ncbi:MAG TPA: site-2 protease family protein [Planctomycetota bacterium]|nr:site-2 protease family protein [Planctomycetota bacterium]